MREEFRPTHYYRWLYKHRRRLLEFNCKSISEWEEWRRGLRRKLVELLGGLDYPRSSLSPKVIGEYEGREYKMMRIEFRSDRFTVIPAFLLKPKGDGERAAILALHGHGYGKSEIVGLDETGKPRSEGEGYQKDFALALAKKGFVVLVIDQAGFGERREEEDARKGAGQSSCWQLATWALLYGETVIGFQLT